MNGNASKIGEQPDTLMAMAAYIKLARSLGAREHAALNSHSIGAHRITLRFTEPATEAELSAWRAASDQAWETVSYSYDTETGEHIRHTEARIRFQGARFDIAVSEPAQLTAVAA